MDFFFNQSSILSNLSTIFYSPQIENNLYSIDFTYSDESEADGFRNMGMKIVNTNVKTENRETFVSEDEGWDEDNIINIVSNEILKEVVQIYRNLSEK